VNGLKDLSEDEFMEKYKQFMQTPLLMARPRSNHAMQRTAGRSDA
jgi:hypothetical protein